MAREKRRPNVNASDDAPSVKHKTIERLAAEVVKKAAPGESNIISDTSNDAKNPKFKIRNTRMMGFGKKKKAKFLTPIIFLIVENALDQMTGEEGTITLFERWKRKIFKRTAPSSLHYTLSEIQENAYNTAIEFNVGVAEAKLIAETLVSQLATIKAEKGNEQ